MRRAGTRQGPAAALLACLGLAGCGFHPLHGDRPDAQLPEIFVATIPGRPGQLLRQELQQRLAGSSDSTPQDYTLRVAYALSSEAIDIHGDNTSGRNRIVGRATWTLSSVAPNPVTVTTGSVRSVDGFDTIDTQYFAATIASETTFGRVAGNLADGITTQIATWFASHPAAAGATAAATGGAGVSPIPKNPAPGAEQPASGFLGPQEVPGDNDQSPLQRIDPDGLPSDAIGRTTH